MIIGKKFKLFTIILLLFSVSLLIAGCNESKLKVKFMIDEKAYYTVYTNGNEIIEMPTVPTKEGYEFDGWYWDDEIWSMPFTSDSLLNYSLSKNLLIYAKWNCIKYNITYHLDGGNHKYNQSSYTIETEDINLNNPVKMGYIFEGWYTTNTFDSDSKVSSIVKGSTGNIDLYAKWYCVEYIINYHLDGGINNNNNLNSYNIESENIYLNSPTKSGYVFGGWYLNEEYKSSDRIHIISSGSMGNVDLYAKWVLRTNLYTYNYSSAVFPTNWNPHTYQTTTDADILGYTESGLYEFDYNETKDGYKIVPAMAKSEPVDVSADYVGDEWGIAEGETGRAYKIDLRDDLKWEDGTEINAQSFVNSLYRLLDPQADNYRADSLYSGSLVISSAKEYYYQGEETLYTATTVLTEYSTDLDSKLVWTLAAPSDANNNQEIYFRTFFGFPASYDAAACAAYLTQPGGFLTGTAFTTEVAAKMEGKTLAEIKADPEMNAAWEAVIGWWQTEPNEELHWFLSNYTCPEVAKEKLGIKVVDGDLVLILEKPLEGFELLNSLTTSWLVHEETYDACISTTEDGLYNNTYGTSVETFKSYGPYKLTYFQMDKEYRFTKNENWYGYNDEENKDLYQTTDIVCQFIEESATRLQEFEKGNLDIYTLSYNDYMYSNSNYIYYSEGVDTSFIVLNPDLKGLTAAQEKAGEGVNKTILTIPEFRQALAISFNRVIFYQQLDYFSKSAIGIFNNLIISDPENGITYRSTEEAKDVILKYWGLQDQVGEGKRYYTKDEAIAFITGMNLTEAKAKFNEAYDKAVATGLLKENDIIELKIGMPNGYFKKGASVLYENWMNAVKGTKLEGKLKILFDDSLGNTYIYALQQNTVDVIFDISGQGSALNPYKVISRYTNPELQYDPGVDYSQIKKEIFFDLITDIEGNIYENITLVASVDAWSNKALAGENVTVYIKDTETTITINAGSEMPYVCRTKILAAIEEAVLQQYTMIPVHNACRAILKSMKINYGSKNYIYGIGNGGIKYMTYNFNDAEWIEFVNSNYGVLNYT